VIRESATVTPLGKRLRYQSHKKTDEPRNRSGRGGEWAVPVHWNSLCWYLDSIKHKRQGEPHPTPVHHTVEEYGWRGCKTERIIEYGLLHALATLSSDFKFYTELVSLNVAFYYISILTNSKEQSPSWKDDSRSVGQKNLAFYRHRIVIIVFTGALHWTLSGASLIQSTPSILFLYDPF
jgi:hypothetical protein